MADIFGWLADKGGDVRDSMGNKEDHARDAALTTFFNAVPGLGMMGPAVAAVDEAPKRPKKDKKKPKPAEQQAGGSFLDGIGNSLTGFLDGLAQRQLQSGQTRATPFDNLGAAPNPQIRSLSDLMGDPGLMRVANQQIITENNAIGRENRDRRAQLQRDESAMKRAGDHAQQQTQIIGNQHARAQEAIGKRNDKAQADSQSNVDSILKNIAVNMISDDNVRSQLQAQQGSELQDRTDQQGADDKMLQGLASGGQEALSQYAAAQPMQTRADIGALRGAAIDEIQSNRRKAAENWSQRSSILAQLAAQEQGADESRAGLAMDAYKTRAGIMDGWNQSQAAMMKARSEAEGAGQPDIKDVMKMWNMYMSPVGPSVKYVSKEGNEQNFQPIYADTVDPEVMKWFNETIGGPSGLPPVMRQPQPNIQE